MINIEEDVFYRNSFLLKLLLKGTNKHALFKTILFFSVLYAIVFLLNLLDNSLIIPDINGEIVLGYLEDYGTYFWFISFFLSTYLFKILTKKFLNLFVLNIDYNQGYKLQINENAFFRSIKYDEKYFNKYIKAVNNEIFKIILKGKNQRNTFYAVQIIIAVLFFTFSVYLPLYTNQISGNWNFSFSLYPLGFISNQIKDFIIFVLFIPPLIWGVALITIATRNITKKITDDNKFDIKPLSPDNSGGLKKLGELTLLLFYIVIVQFLQLFATSLVIGFPISHQILYPFYFLFTFFIFFYPIKPVRRAMKKVKRNELNKILKLFDKLYIKYNEELEFKNSVIKIRTNISELLNIRTLYYETKKMHVWPFNIDTLIKFGSFFLMPILAFLLQLLMDPNSIIYHLEPIKESIKKLFFN